MFQGRLKAVSRNFQSCFEGVGCFKEVSMVFLGSFQGVSKKLHGCFMKVTRKIEGCF